LAACSSGGTTSLSSGGNTARLDAAVASTGGLRSVAGDRQSAATRVSMPPSQTVQQRAGRGAAPAQQTALPASQAAMRRQPAAAKPTPPSRTGRAPRRRMSAPSARAGPTETATGVAMPEPRTTTDLPRARMPPRWPMCQVQSTSQVQPPPTPAPIYSTIPNSPRSISPSMIPTEGSTGAACSSQQAQRYA
jgi:hypothetical protein